MKRFASTYRFSGFAAPRTFGTRAVTCLLTIAMVTACMWSGGGFVTSGAEAAAADSCFPSNNPFKVRISWTVVERDLAAPPASEPVVADVTAVITQVYRPDLTVDYTALDRLSTPEYKKMTGLDCEGVAAPPAPGTPAPAADRPRLDQVRQVDPTTVVAFLSVPGHAAGPAPGATPAKVGVNGEGTPYPGTVVTDAVYLVVFVQRDGHWTIDFLSGAQVNFSDVVSKDPQLRANGGTYSVEAIDLRDTGMPALPADCILLATPEATPGS